MQESNVAQNSLQNNIPQVQPQVQPIENQTQVSKPASKSKLPLILMIFLFIVVLFSGAYYLLNQSKNTNQQKQTSVVPTTAPSLTSIPSPTQTPTVNPSPQLTSSVDNPNLKTYISPLGVSFTYSPKQVSNSDWTITVKESGNKICVTYDVNDVNCLKGQYVQVFQKSITDSLKNAIKKQFLTNYSLNDCFILSQNPYSGFSYPASYKTAIISFPKSSDPNALPWANAEKCPPSYTATNGLAYFLEDILHPSKMLFFSIGQYSIESDNNKSWEQTIKVLN